MHMLGCLRFLDREVSTKYVFLFFNGRLFCRCLSTVSFVQHIVVPMIQSWFLERDNRDTCLVLVMVH